jgi:hypothetical protein
MTHHHHTAVDASGHILPSTVKAPEINPSEGFAAVLLLAGMLAVLVGRRRA